MKLFWTLSVKVFSVLIFFGYDFSPLTKISSFLTDGNLHQRLKLFTFNRKYYNRKEYFFQLLYILPSSSSSGITSITTCSSVELTMRISLLQVSSSLCSSGPASLSISVLISLKPLFILIPLYWAGLPLKLKE